MRRNSQTAVEKQRNSQLFVENQHSRPRHRKSTVRHRKKPSRRSNRRNLMRRLRPPRPRLDPLLPAFRKSIAVRVLRGPWSMRYDADAAITPGKNLGPFGNHDIELGLPHQCSVNTSPVPRWPAFCDFGELPGCQIRPAFEGGLPVERCWTYEPGFREQPALRSRPYIPCACPGNSIFRRRETLLARPAQRECAGKHDTLRMTSGEDVVLDPG